MTDPLLEYVDRLNIRENERHELLRLYGQQRIALQASPHDSVPGNPGSPVVPVTPGPATSEYSYTRWAMWAGAGLGVLFTVLLVLSAFGFKVDLEYARQIADLFQSVVIAVVGFAFSRGLVKGGASIGTAIMKGRTP